MYICEALNDLVHRVSEREVGQLSADSYLTRHISALRKDFEKVDLPHQDHVKRSNVFLSRLLAEGGTSWVFIGMVGHDDDSTINYRVVKVAKTHDEITNSTSKKCLEQHPALFAHEAHVMNSLQSEDVAQVQHQGTSAAGRDYICFKERLWANDAFPTLSHLLAFQGHFGSAQEGAISYTPEEALSVAAEYKAYHADLSKRDRRHLLAAMFGSRVPLPYWFNFTEKDCEEFYALDRYGTAVPNDVKIPSKSLFCYRALAPVLACDVARGIKAAHTAGFVHRDIKPDNYLVYIDYAGRDASCISAKLGDFQAAAALDSKGEYLGVSHGSERYASPELLRNASGATSEAITTASDIFSVGLIIAQIINPRIRDDLPPAIGHRLDRSPREQILSIEQRLDKTRLDEAAANIAARTGPYEHIVRKCLAFHPSDRYSGATSLLEDLTNASNTMLNQS